MKVVMTPQELRDYIRFMPDDAWLRGIRFIRTSPSPPLRQHWM